MRRFFAAFAIAAMALGGAACSSLPGFQDPAEWGCSPSETNECRVVAAALLVKASNQTIAQQLTAGAITVSEASRLRGLTKKAEDAVVAARAVLPLENGTTVDRLNTLTAILRQLLREQVIRTGA